jgi:hypothetical protein
VNARELLSTSKDGDELKARLIAEFPDFTGAAMQVLKQHGKAKVLKTADWPSFVETVRPNTPNANPSRHCPSRHLTKLLVGRSM